MTPVSVTLNFSSAADLVAFFTGAGNAPAAAAAPTPARGKAKAEDKPADAPHPANAEQAAALKEVKAELQGNAQPSASATAAAAPSDAKPQEAAKPTPAATGSSIDYPTLQKAVVALHKVDPQAALDIAKGMGFENFKAMPADKWAEALALVNTKAAELAEAAAVV